MLKRILIGVFAIAIALTLVPIAGAQGPDGAPERDRRPREELVFRQLLRAAADETGTQPVEVLRARAGGQSLNEYIAEHGGDADNAMDSVLAQIDELLSRAVDNDRITEQQKNDMLEDIEARLAEVMSNDEPIDFPLNDRERNVVGELIGRATIQQTAIVTETEPQQVLRARAGGQSLNDYIAEHGGDANTVVANVMVRVEEQLANQVTAGRISQEFMDEAMTTIEQGIMHAMANSEPLDLPQRDRPNRDRPNRDQPERDGPFGVDVLGIIMDGTGLTEQEIRPQLGSGLTLEDIITDAGIDFDTVKADIITAFTERADEALANGEVSEEQYNQFLSQIDERITNFLTTPRKRAPVGIDNSDGQNAGVLE